MPLDAATAPPALRCAEIVRRMEELLARPESWCQYATRLGNATCIPGAAYSAADTTDDRSIFDALTSMAGIHVAIWNDDPARTHTDVLDLLARTRRYFEEAV